MEATVESLIRKGRSARRLRRHRVAAMVLAAACIAPVRVASFGHSPTRPAAPFGGGDGSPLCRGLPSRRSTRLFYSEAIGEVSIHASEDFTLRKADDGEGGPLLDARARRLRRLNSLIDRNNEAIRMRSDVRFDEEEAFGVAVGSRGDSSVPTSPKAEESTSGRSGLAAAASAAIHPPAEIPPPVTSTQILGADRLHDATQLESIKSTAPAVLLRSGPGTGKSSVLSARIAYLLRTRQCDPERMVVVSFAGKDAAALKRRALDLLYPPEEVVEEEEEEEEMEGGERKMSKGLRKDLSRRIWSGTIHSFAASVLRQYGGDGADRSVAPRIVSTKEMRRRVKECLQSMIREKERRTFRLRFKDALDDAGQNFGMLLSSVVRCIELWKEAALLSPPLLHSIRFVEAEEEFGSVPERILERENRVREDCVELAMRLGVPPSAAVLALDVYPEYQATHVAANTADPSDLASIAYNFLLSHPEALAAVRMKLQHIILDEYQDVSVSQHRLLRLVVRGVVDESIDGCSGVGEHEEIGGVGLDKRAVLKDVVEGSVRSPSTEALNAGGSCGPVCYAVPRLFCAGDSNQSIYGWRGAAPSVSVEGFRRDYPQGIIVPLGTSYRLPRYILSAANILLAPNRPLEPMNSFPISPAGAKIASSMMTTWTENSRAGPFPSKKKVSLLEADGPIIEQSVQEFYRLGQQLLLSNHVSSESSSLVHIQGLWDAREEAKFIASTIRKRSKERKQCCAHVLNSLSDGAKMMESELSDTTDVAVMVRSASQMKMIEEALLAARIPFVVPTSETCSTLVGHELSINLSRTSQWGSNVSGKQDLSMKPVKVITMHRAKGDEFDDIYLAGFNEGIFPHPTSVSSNRIHEERRLAYVTLTRARQRVVVTYSFFLRTIHVNGRGQRKSVMMQVKPSRFLEELMPPPEEDGRRIEGQTVWNDTYGVKESIAGRNLPSHFAKSFVTPDGFKPVNSLPKPLELGKAVYVSKHGEDRRNVLNKPNLPTRSKSGEGNVESESVDTQPVKNASQTTSPMTDSYHVTFLKRALNEMAKKRANGLCKKYREAFRGMLLDRFGIRRGAAIVLTDSKNMDIDALRRAPENQLTTRPLSQCTAKQLGQYLAYLFLQQNAAI